MRELLIGKGAVHWGPRRIGSVAYKIHINPANERASVVELEPKPPTRDGEFVNVILEDGRVVTCQVFDDSPFCAVIGEGPIIKHPKRVRDK